MVIGAGVVGLAVARELALAGREVLVLERHELIGSETSSRHSEVIHAGIYYPTGSVKAETCVRGKALLYDYCRSHAVPHARIGKIIVATRESHFETLRGYRAQARENGVGELPWLDADEVSELEPAVGSLGGIYSESTGIVDSHALMLSLQGDLEARGGVVSLCTEVTGLRRHGDRVGVACGDYELSAATAVNAAGLSAPALAGAFRPGYRGFFAKGHYYALSGASPFKHLVYPVAESGGSGSTSPWTSPGRPVSAPTWCGSTVRTTISTRPAGPASSRPSAATTRGSTRSACTRDTRASARRSCPPAPRPGTSSSRGRRNMACPAWSTCSASSRPA